MKHILILFFCIPLAALSQNPITYNINVVTSASLNDKQIFVSPAIFTGTNEYNENKIETTTITVKNNRFQLSGVVKYPTPVSFTYQTTKGGKNIFVLSDFLFLDNGTIDIVLNDLASDKEIKGQMNSKANKEYRDLKKLYKNLEIDNGSRTIVEKGNIAKKDDILKSYIQRHQDSYVAMWVFIYDYQLYGYSNTKNEIARLFSKEIKSTASFKTLLNKIKTDKALLVNNNFPFYHFPFGQDIENTVKQSKYTLVDFWASYCKPCIAQFPDLIKIYSENKQNGFNIYSVSLDKEIDLKKMDSILTVNGIQWKNKVDFDGLQSLKLNISGIPRSFLLDAKGKIIAANINYYKLRTLLKENE